MIAVNPIETFFNNVRIDSSGCWIWMLKKVRGYGYISVKRKSNIAHRWIYQLLNGPISKTIHIDHLCFNRSCVNPDHLEAVTPKENKTRAMRRRTHCKHGHILSEDNIYSPPKNPDQRHCKICRKYHSDNLTIKRRYKNIQGE